jgi:hypothetical protein
MLRNTHDQNYQKYAYANNPYLAEQRNLFIVVFKARGMLLFKNLPTGIET